ncbi:extensin [Erythrobacter sp. 3-20A1M]|uniref:extensin-like domain-containing protein n=1 Tax=Erythrobacter sp. 3-20A1M TaxID=2653850 RepID=UPI001BFCA908|nr:extensin family protein [Erythrobacter sp. 3-20A1M]QWC58047.1 extensin [Erythrobacter sp. 3-20A1M]
MSGRSRLSRRLGRFRRDRALFWLLVLLGLFVAGRAWLADHPGDDPWAPLDLREEPGWATARKITALRNDPAQCRAVLERSAIAFRQLEPAGEGACRREDRTQLTDFPLNPTRPPTTCAVAAALELWLRDGVNPIAQEIYGSKVARIEHYGSYSCRRLYGRDSGPWSEHATGNAIDIAAFVLADGTRISVLRDWDSTASEPDRADRFLHAARDRACDVFGTVLSPDYNDAHRDHFHLDQEARGFGGVCR